MSLIQKGCAIVMALAIAGGILATVGAASGADEGETTAAIQHLDRQITEVKTDLATVQGDLAEAEALIAAMLDSELSPFVFADAPEELPTERRSHVITGAHSATSTVIHACFGDTVRFVHGRPNLNNGMLYLTQTRNGVVSHEDVNISPPLRVYTPWSEADKHPYLWTNQRDADTLTAGTITWRDCGFTRPAPAE